MWAFLTGLLELAKFWVPKPETEKAPTQPSVAGVEAAEKEAQEELERKFGPKAGY